ncbi:MAG: hypothetical protein IAE82_06685 [Opitutaceae bacterium]|nr:hypothetical protein [Opitutaceae bacterium]
MFPSQATTLEPPAPKVPEGESVNHAIDQLPRARALHDEIIGLIRAVRGRFG